MMREEAEQSSWWARQGCIVKVVVVLVVIGAIGMIIGAVRDGGTSDRSTPMTFSSTTTVLDPAKQVVLVDGTLKVKQHNSIGCMELTGKVKNKGRVALQFVKVRGYALTDSGATVNTHYGYIDSDILAPGGTATYKIFVDDPNHEATHGRVVIEGARFAE